MPNKPWKTAEREIGRRYWGCKRRGPDTSARDEDDDRGLPDLICPGWSVEVKHRKRPTFGLMVEAVEQAENNALREDDIPVAVIHKKGSAYGDSLVIMRLDTFRDFFIIEKDPNNIHTS